MARWRWLAASALVLAGCAGDDPPAATGQGTPSGTLRVFAAASLTEAFTALGTRFEADHPGVRVAFTFAASSALARQIADGASADVFASADGSSMATVTGADLGADPEVIARNRLAILVEAGNPKGVAGLGDLDDPGVVLVLCAPEVPCGRLAAAALDRAGVRATPASLEENVKAVVAKVILGEADAGLVYATDVRAAGDQAEGVDLDPAVAADPALEAVYPMAVLTEATNREAAEAWATFVGSAPAQDVLASFGFRPA